MNEAGIEVVAAPYDAGQRGRRMGRGPMHLIEAGLPEAATAPGRPVRTAVIDLGDAYPSENVTAFEVIERVAARVHANQADGRFTLLLSGNCNAMVGAVAAAANRPADPLGLLWLDSHPDFETPESTLHGSLDGMGLAMATGACWRAKLDAIPDFAPVDERHTILVGGRQASPAETERLEQSDVAVIAERDHHDRLTGALDALAGAVARIHVHVDLDVLDRDSVGSANEYASSGGLTVEEVVACVEQARRRFAVTSASIASYDPEGDRDNRVLHAAFRVTDAILDGAGTTVPPAEYANTSAARASGGG